MKLLLFNLFKCVINNPKGAEMKCNKTGKETTKGKCSICNRKCELAVNSRYNKVGAYKNQGRRQEERKVSALTIASIPIELEAKGVGTTGNYINAMPAFIPKPPITLGIKDIIYGTKPIIVSCKAPGEMS